MNANISSNDYKGIYVYSITNKVNGKKYIGISGDLYNRKRAHNWALENNRHSNIKLQNAWNKYRVESFEFEVLEELKTDIRNEALEVELKYIKEHDTFRTGYNMSEGGDGSILQKQSKETLLKKSKAMMGNTHGLGKRHSQETKDRIGLLHRGKHVTKEMRKRMSEARIGRFSGKDNPFYGKTHSEETRALLRTRGREVMCIETGITYDNAVRCAEDMGIPKSRRNISRVCHGKAKSCKGYTFKFV